MDTYYFKPHLINENPEWLNVNLKGESFTLMPNTCYTADENQLVYVKSGYVRFYCNTDVQKNVFVFIVGQNSLVNASAIMTEIKRVSYICTDIETEILIYDSSLLWEKGYIQNNQELYFGLARNIAKTTKTILNRAHKTCFYDVTTRICRVLLDITEIKSNNNTQYVQNLTQNDIARLAGVHPVTASTVIKYLREQNVIGNLYKDHIEIFDYQALEHYCTI